MSAFKTKSEGDEYLLDDPRIHEALEAVMREDGCQVLMDVNRAGAFRVRISYGDLERDEKVSESFDEAEWGVSKANLTEALRFVLGQHYHQEP